MKPAGARATAGNRPGRLWAGLALAAWLALPAHSGAAEVHASLAAAASLLIPGAGQAINGDLGEGAVHFSLELLLINRYLALVDDDRYLEFDEREDEANHFIDVNRTTFEADLVGTGLLNLSFYSAFGAYRDNRLASENAGYSTPPPRESLADLVTAPYRLEWLTRPSTYVALALPLVALLIPPSDDQLLFRPDSTISRDELAAGFYAQHHMVAVGEEAFFRGVLNNGFSNNFGNSWGLAVSSLAFGIGHEGQGGQASAFGATLFGAYLGYLQQENDFRIGQGVAIHFWWNFLTSLGMLEKREADQTVRLFSIYLPF